MHVKRNVAATQGYGCWFILHVGETALFFGPPCKAYAARLELFTPMHRFRFSGFKSDHKGK